MNVRLDAGFVEAPYVEQAQRFRQWLHEGAKSRILVIEIGAGFNTPSVVRWRMEHLVQQHPGARLIRINPSEPELPEALGERAVALAMGAEQALGLLEQPKLQGAEAKQS
ncbi:hypothetical protein OV208_09760 [Corallococcus sp. bb12-1]|uniref:hypothetical protein n=1 Tax=Corallococcus sp. bb12-1 TaxID=2996784 RepID=UPI00226E0230|nr:hypothetical protein [Corallococcus sp. bb12-1]MCY1041599.1 hypothetical protein [Corallococcus sp. bb12-1]